MDGINKRIDDEKIEREKGLNNLSDRLSTEIRDREEVNEAVTDALQVNKWYRYQSDLGVIITQAIFQWMDW